ncbi:MAG: hypothetical protein ACKPKO_12260, partial [Candidatus Fonsibacter sp.]
KRRANPYTIGGILLISKRRANPYTIGGILLISKRRANPYIIAKRWWFSIGLFIRKSQKGFSEESR